MKGLLNEIKAMNKIAGTQLTKEQEITLIKERLTELEFGSQKELDAYKKAHKVRKGTELKVSSKKAEKKKSKEPVPSVFQGKQFKGSKMKGPDWVKPYSKKDKKQIRKSIDTNAPATNVFLGKQFKF